MLSSSLSSDEDEDKVLEGRILEECLAKSPSNHATSNNVIDINR